VAQVLREHGWKEARALAGGFDEYLKLGLPLVSK
jgi:hypothetical protein